MGQYSDWPERFDLLLSLLNGSAFTLAQYSEADRPFSTIFDVGATSTNGSY